MRELKKVDEERRIQMSRQRKRDRETQLVAEQLREEQASYFSHMRKIEAERVYLIHKREEFSKELSLSDPASMSQEAFENMTEVAARLARLETESEMLKARIRDSSAKLLERDIKLDDVPWGFNGRE